MTVLNLVKYPDPILKRVCDPVPTVNDDTRKLVANMLETMVAKKGVGLAAPQVGFSLRLFVVDIWWNQTGQYDKSLVFINPRITAFEGSQRGQEGCLSIPGIFEHVTRAKKIRIAAQGGDGLQFELEAEDHLAVAIQHELDHLNGVLMLDKLSPLARKMAAKKNRLAGEAMLP